MYVAQCENDVIIFFTKTNGFAYVQIVDNLYIKY